MKFLLTLTTLALTSGAFAALNDSATLSLKGNVPKNVSISVDSTVGNQTLPLSSGASGLKIATLREKSNVTEGYTVTVSSTNGGVLKNGTEEISYSITYGGSAVASLAGTGSVLPRSNRTAGAGDLKDVEISFDSQDSTKKSGDYTDTLTFAIAAN